MLEWEVFCAGVFYIVIWVGFFPCFGGKALSGSRSPGQDGCQGGPGGLAEPPVTIVSRLCAIIQGLPGTSYGSRGHLMRVASVSDNATR